MYVCVCVCVFWWWLSVCVCVYVYYVQYLFPGLVSLNFFLPINFYSSLDIPIVGLCSFPK